MSNEERAIIVTGLVLGVVALALSVTAIVLVFVG
jgi:hypothetical protein